MKRNSKFQIPNSQKKSKFKIQNKSDLSADRQNPKLSEEEVEHIAKLARLKLTKAEVKMFCSQLSEVLEYMKVLNEVETESIEPTAQVTGLENVFREDEVSNSLNPQQALSHAPATEGNYFKTGVVLEK
jgi:aspartyl-tRNA(Asn)/glutamyl-tRNA(Gln) amidotransferase subunit C